MKHSLLAAFLLTAFSSQATVSEQSEKLANYAVEQYQQAQIHTLENLVSYPTVNKEGLATPDNPDFIGFKSFLKMKAAQFSFDYQDLGYTVLIGMGNQADKATIVTRSDVQPADAVSNGKAHLKWIKPLNLKLIARGTEDDKGAIFTALHAMKAIKDNGITLNNRIELMVYLAEESDWAPLEEFMKTYQQPKYAVTIDASYPVVVAEKAA